MDKLMQRLVLASNNQGKIGEIKALLSGIEVLAQTEFGVPECPEPALTFVENSLLKARHAATYCQLPVIADDSGLIVHALNGQPGVRSARYAGDNASDQDNNDKLLSELSLIEREQRLAQFVCVMVLLRHADDPCPLIAQGVWQGEIAMTPQGDNGFGYDALFWLPELNCTAAQLSNTQKNQLSHRGQALRQLRNEILKQTLSF
ncbi:RdgB/HAM1 family non-canonical purine NTP pyrophosphatase [Methylocucumis oryzae]|uniref:dITP/XTP pyrophosphatase n=1 Tax=Methylocucumis oryzae TaxID=1632867 RepID=A0A0F3IFU2_9GAMM|nr:RdgB/HAM1 family non-canonical purine NTP pyrophosphatase [Methylocucumis oryzae]KJV05423.1 nucleoside-triphosphate diphosphatase [Methylocucumis oryzae]